MRRGDGADEANPHNHQGEENAQTPHGNAGRGRHWRHRHIGRNRRTGERRGHQPSRYRQSTDRAGRVLPPPLPPRALRVSPPLLPPTLLPPALLPSPALCPPALLERGRSLLVLG